MLVTPEKVCWAANMYIIMEKDRGNWLKNLDILFLC